MSEPDSPLRSIFGEALEIKDPQQRSAFLSQACGADTALRKEIEELIQAETEAGHFLPDEPATRARSAVLGSFESQDSVGTSLSVPLAEQPSERIGRYKLLQKIGEGGCGVVYMAEQEEPVRRKVALKVIKLGMDTKSVVARFEAERQALAMMDHPNIAKVLEAGATETGRPFFVMELVRGIKITKYCDEQKSSTKERLELFIQVCQAVQHAHQKGIIHRDLKPSNILVTERDGLPVPKVIDFGIAKATGELRLTDKTLFTAFEQFIGTPAYMSPEQARLGELDIDTRSDIYSLGVLLYELLVGKTPFDTKELMAAGLDEIRRTIREKEPVRPSTRLSTMLEGERTTTAKQRAAESPKLIHLLRGDLDWIVMKSLEKDRTRRYDTANGLAMDIQRHLNNEPVVARPPSAGYRFQKLVRRNKLVFAAASAVALALIAGLGFSTWSFLRERKAHAGELAERRTADDQRQRAEASELTARRNLYAADMILAREALDKGNLGRLRELLARYEPAALTNVTNGPARLDLRGWEWRYLWKSSRGDDLFALRGHSNEVPVSLFLADSRTIFSASPDRTLRFWDLQTKSLIESIPYPDNPCSAALSPDGRWLVVGGRFGYWGLWDALSRRLLMANTNSSGVLGAAFSPDGRQFAITDNDLVEVWNTADRRKAKTISRNNGRGRGDFLHGLAFSPDGKKLAYCHWDERIILHDLFSGSQAVLGTPVRGEALSLKFSPDGRVVVSAEHGGISVWDVAGRAPPKHLTNHLEQVVCVAFSPDGSLLASASGDQTVKLWETQNWQEIASLRGHEHEVYSVAFSPDGKFIVSSAKDETVRVWSVQRESRARDRLRSPDSSFYVPKRPTRGRMMRVLYKGQSWESVSFLDLTKLEETSPQVVPPIFPSDAPVAVDPRASLVAVGSKEGAVELWRPEPFEKLRVVAASQTEAKALALGESGRWLAVARRDETTELWDLEANRLIETLPPLAESVRGDSTYEGLSFWANDRRLVRATSASRYSPELIEVLLVPERERRLIRHTHKGGLHDFALSDDGNLLATAAWDGQVKLWDVPSGRELGTLRGQLVGFMGLAFSPDGSRLGAGAMDGSITLWDIGTRQQVSNWKAHRRACDWLCFINGGTILASSGDSSGMDTLETRLWRAPSWDEIAFEEQRQKTAPKR